MSIKKGIISTVILVSLLSLTGVTSHAATSGNSDATVLIKGGELSFKDLPNSAHIEFADTEITGNQITAQEKSADKSRINLSDYRGLATGQGSFSVSVRDITNRTDGKGFEENGMFLYLSPKNVTGQGSHSLHPVMVSSYDGLVFGGTAEAGITARSVILNPTLQIPDHVSQAGNYGAELLWSIVAGNP